MIAIMNPPYDKNLHLKILNETIKHCDNIVSLQPVRWLQDPLASYKKHSDWNKFENVRKHIESIDVFTSDGASKVFGARFSFDLGVYKMSPKDDNTSVNEMRFNKDGINFKSIFNKVAAHKDKIKDHIEHNMRDGIRYRVQTIKPMADFDPRSGRDYTPDHSKDYDFASRKRSNVYVDGKNKNGIDWVLEGNRNQFSKKEGSPFPESIKFGTKQEAVNFEAYVWTKFFRFCNFMTKHDVNVQISFLPYMSDYTKQWTDEELYDYFNLTDDEIKIIEETIK